MIDKGARIVWIVTDQVRDESKQLNTEERASKGGNVRAANYLAG